MVGAALAPKVTGMIIDQPVDQVIQISKNQALLQNYVWQAISLQFVAQTQPSPSNA